MMMISSICNVLLINNEKNVMQDLIAFSKQARSTFINMKLVRHLGSS